MIRLASCFVLAILAAAAGCSMCAHPYDYCGPTFAGGDCSGCDPRVRAGSILSGGMMAEGTIPPGAVFDDATAPGQPTPAPTPAEPLSPTVEPAPKPINPEAAVPPPPVPQGAWIGRPMRSTR